MNGTVFIILIFALYFPLMFLGYYVYKKFLAKMGISTVNHFGSVDYIDTNIGKNIKMVFYAF